MAFSYDAQGSVGYSREADRSPHMLPSSLWEKCNKDLKEHSEKVKGSSPAPPSPHGQPHHPADQGYNPSCSQVAPRVIILSVQTLWSLNIVSMFMTSMSSP